MSSGFGKWYEEKKQEGESSTNSAWGIDMSGDSLLPLFSTDNLPQVSFASMKQSMEAQMPKKILGMGYQQRFKVCTRVQTIVLLLNAYSTNICIVSVGLLWITLLVGPVFCACLFCGHAHDCSETTKVCHFVHHG
jgi:hypothetical protein